MKVWRSERTLVDRIRIQSNFDVLEKYTEEDMRENSEEVMQSRTLRPCFHHRKCETCALLNQLPLPPSSVADITFYITPCNLLLHEQHTTFSSGSSSSRSSSIRLDICLEVVRELCEEVQTRSKSITHIQVSISRKWHWNCTAVTGTKFGLL